MKARYILIPLFVIIILIFAYLVYCGLFYSVEVKEVEKGPFTLVYEKHIGPYKGVRKIRREIYQSLLYNEEIQTYKGFGIYYDNPRRVDKSKLRSIVGCILEEKDYNKIKILKKNFRIGVMPASRHVYAEFPLKAGLSVTLGLIKAYPKLNRYVKQKGYGKVPVMEIYDIPNRKVMYHFGVNIDKKVFDSFLK